ncbi:putative metal-sulfur cluster biosynthetic enzyme [Aciduliprofundum sp. MAR08-339]|uniref:metal-sulfur cluster assembly factor n=1 Tax=Aciduliprofundum sp. (strain MAR08-339) TaxID=673860 RepID=UPI0002A4910D|nr:putative metal-sulfur cluster biosynthetic enzyme [Aciduliprofundum sp. MAR08-339]
MVSEKEVWDALKRAIDFELGVDVVNLGLIYEVRVDNGKDVYIKMTLTTPTCPLANAIIADVYQKVKAIEGVENVDIEVTFDPPWNPDMMSPQAKKLLGI